MRGVFVCGATRFSDADVSHSAGGGVHAPAVYIDNGACGHFVYTALRKRASTRIWSEQRTHDRVNHAFYLYTGAAYMGRLQSSRPLLVYKPFSFRLIVLYLHR